MIRAILTLALVLALPAYAQPRPDLSPREADGLRDQYQYQYPKWCQHWSRVDFRRDMFDCHGDMRCRHYVRSKASRCGLLIR